MAVRATSADYAKRVKGWIFEAVGENFNLELRNAGKGAE
jgi:hypothetical protein